MKKKVIGVQSLKVVNGIVEQLIKITQRDVDVNNMLKKYLIKYCSVESLKYCNEIYKESCWMVRDKEEYVLEKQPPASAIDNYCSTGETVNRIQKQELVAEQLKKTPKISDKIVKKSSIKSSKQQITTNSNDQKIKQNNCYKLHIQQQQPDSKIIQYLKQQYQLSNIKKINTLSINTINPKSYAEKINVDKVSFDYDGKTFNIKNQNKYHFVKNGISGCVQNQQHQYKQSQKNDKIPIPPKQQPKKQPTNKSASTKQPHPLIQTLQSRKAMKSVSGIKVPKQYLKNHALKKLNKRPYPQIKQSKYLDDYNPHQTNNKLLNQQQKNQKYQLQYQSKSQSKLINYNTSNQLSQEQGDHLVNNNKKGYQDNYNGKGGQNNEEVKKKKQVKNSMDVKLPKINSHRNQLCKIKEKKKEQEDGFKSIRKKMEDKLRI